MLSSYLTKSRTKNRLIDVLSVIYDIHYTTIPLLKTVKSGAIHHIATGPSFAELKNFKILSEIKEGIFCLDTEGYKLLDKEPQRLRGGSEHDLQVATHVLQALTESGATVIYPRFERQRLYPDACLIYKDEGRYRIEFLEVELSPKPDGYLDEKMRKYKALGKDPTLHSDWWRTWSERLGLPYCTRDQFCFGVRVETI